MFEAFEGALVEAAKDLAATDLIDEGIANWANQSLVDADSVINLLLDLRSVING